MKDSSTKEYTLRQAAELLGVSPTTLRVQLHKGRIKGKKHGRDWFVDGQTLAFYRKEVRQK